MNEPRRDRRQTARTKAVEAKEKREEVINKKKDELKSLFSSVFESDQGQKVYKNLYDFAKCGTDMFFECKDDREFAYISGRQSILLHIKKILEDK